ncbi:hypothetical protein HBI70_078470 [Parastagonospora nodorum]|nr:hypothetical protein HBI70_078470 [Parastagonospora nodorum]
MISACQDLSNKRGRPGFDSPSESHMLQASFFWCLFRRGQEWGGGGGEGGGGGFLAKGGPGGGKTQGGMIGLEGGWAFEVRQEVFLSKSGWFTFMAN